MIKISSRCDTMNNAIFVQRAERGNIKSGIFMNFNVLTFWALNDHAIHKVTDRNKRSKRNS